MKKNVRKALAISGMAITIGTVGIISDASASAYQGNTQARWSQHERTARSRKFEHRFAFHGRKIFFGTVSEVSGNSFILTKKSGALTVKIDSSSRILNKKWQKIGITDIKDGDRVKVLGTLDDTTITAKTIRDISLQ